MYQRMDYDILLLEYINLPIFVKVIEIITVDLDHTAFNNLQNFKFSIFL